MLVCVTHTFGQPNIRTRKLVVEEGGFKYDSDSYADDLPYWSFEHGNKPHLIIPYTLSENDMCFVRPANFPTGNEFYECLKNDLRYRVLEGKAGHPTIMSIGLHCRLSRPGRVAGLAAFMDYAMAEFGDSVWFCTREQIADHWYEQHYPDNVERPVK